AWRAAIQQGADLSANLFRDAILVDVPGLGLGQNFWLELTGQGRDDANGVEVVHIHEAQGRKAVEPDIGYPLDHLPFAIPCDGRLELLHGLRMLAPRGGTW